MLVYDDYIPSETFSEFVRTMPQCCIELVITTDAGVLLAKRANEPVKDEWFWPGSRLYKGEPLPEAAHRVAQEELGIDIEIIEQLGVHEHFWESSAEAGNPSRHTVNIVFLVEPADPECEVSLDDQHTAAKFVKNVDEAYHEYVHEYFAKHDLPR